MRNYENQATGKNNVQIQTRGQSPAQRLTAALLTLALVVAGMAGLFPAAAQAQTAHTLTVVSQNVILNEGGPMTVNVPITVNATSNRKISSAAFALDYSATCLQYTATNFSGIDNDFERSVANNVTGGSGKLNIAIFDQDSPRAEIIVNSTLVTVTFTVLAACQTDGSTPVNFAASPAPSLGNPGGQSVPVTPVNGTVTIDWNRPATAITLTPNTIAENQPVNTTVGTVASNDPDGANDTYTFTLVAGAGGDDNAIFTLTGTTLTANAPFNYEVKKDYTVRIQVSDGKGSSFAQAVTIEVVDVNETPTVLALDNNSVIEDLGSAGQVVANVTVTDPDNFDSYNTPDTFTMALAGADAAYFEVSDLQIKVRAAGLETAESKPSYTFDVVITDNAGNLYPASNTYTQSVTFAVVNHSELRIRTIAVSRPPLWTTIGGALQVPVNFTAKANAVRSSIFQVTFDAACLSFAGVTGPGAAGSANGGVATITGASSSDYADGDLFTLTFNATGACVTADDLTNPVYGLHLTAAALTGASSNALPVYRFDGQAYVIPNDARGDCNSDGFIDAADFTAIALEIFDDADSSSADDGYWLNAWNVYSPPFEGTDLLFKGSPLGCDASPHIDLGVSLVQVADILCTVSVVFGDTSCSTPSTARALHTPTPASLNVSATAGDGNTVEVTLGLASNNSAAGAAFSLTYDPAQLAIDPTDADQDGIPDAIVLNGPADYLKLAQVSFLNDQVDFALVDTTAPLSAIGDGVLATVRFTKVGAGDPKITLTNASVGDGNASTLPVVVEYGQGLAQAVQRLFLPAVTR
jgi:hypothetical protein